MHRPKKPEPSKSAEMTRLGNIGAIFVEGFPAGLIEGVTETFPLQNCLRRSPSLPPLFQDRSASVMLQFRRCNAVARSTPPESFTRAVRDVRFRHYDEISAVSAGEGFFAGTITPFLHGSSCAQPPSCHRGQFGRLWPCSTKPTCEPSLPFSRSAHS
jgi:hypothetical protein